MTATYLTHPHAVRLRADARETIASVPRMVADAMDAPVAVFVPSTGEAMMVDLFERRSAFPAPEGMVRALVEDLATPGTTINGSVSRATHVVQDVQGRRVGVVGVFDHAARQGGWQDDEQLRRLGEVIADELGAYVEAPPAPPAPEPHPGPGPTSLGSAYRSGGGTGGIPTVGGATPIQHGSTPGSASAPWNAPAPRRPVKDPTVPLAPMRPGSPAAERQSLDAMWQQGAQPVTAAPDDRELRERSLTLADDVAGAGDTLAALLERVDQQPDQVLHRHAAAVQQRFATVERSRARLRAHLEGNPDRPRTRAMFDLPRVVDEAISTVYQTYPGSRVDVDLIDDSLTVSADPGVVQRAVTVLLATAVESAHDRTARISVGVRSEDSTSIDGRLSVQLSVSFAGEQLTAGQLARLAGRFAEASRGSAGSRDRTPPARMQVTAAESSVSAGSFEARSGRDRSAFVAQWPLDLG